MNYYAAPMEGLTDRIWRQVHQKWFGAADAPTRYYAPFLSPPENRVLIPKKMAELAPEANAGTVVIPQERIDEVVAFAQKVRQTEERVIAEIRAGADPIEAHERVNYDNMLKAKG